MQKTDQNEKPMDERTRVALETIYLSVCRFLAEEEAARGGGSSTPG
jgi:hypothetical protein